MNDRFIILLRHGAYRQKPGTPSALQPFDLTETGKAQAKAAGLELAELARAESWQLSPQIFCSRQLRSWQTATLLGKTISETTGRTFEITETEALAERSVGALANLTIPEIEHVLMEDPRHEAPPENWKSDSHYKLPVQGAESLMEAGARVAEFLQKRVETMPHVSGKTAQICVGHGAALRHAAHHLGILSFPEIRKVSMHHAKAVVLRYSPNAGWSHHTGTWKERQVLELTMD
ncbi:histidine phosphatase family protein [uncultured Roseibium sp.]|uniref:histidine phosphatase family protein n=1 Tax=uncultured Roseibium sp. TaxID=1936171 RepID=UPI0026296D0F|nr:histidine phosphatase family protein [uncultured Roseibium sp.]